MPLNNPYSDPHEIYFFWLTIWVHVVIYTAVFDIAWTCTVQYHLSIYSKLIPGLVLSDIKLSMESLGMQEILFPWCISSYSLTCLIPLVKREAGMFFAPCRGGGIWLIINATFWWKSVVMCLSEGSNFVTLGQEILLYCLVKWLETITMTDADGAFYSCIWRIWFFLELYVNCYKGVGCKKGTSCQSDSWKFSL